LHVKTLTPIIGIPKTNNKIIGIPKKNAHQE